MQYTNITMVKGMAPPSLDYLKAIHGAEAGPAGTPADFFDALLVGLDALNRAVTERPELATKCNKRVLLVRP